MINKVISGGQTGADIAGLKAAKLAGIETGGHAPKGYRTQTGSNYELRDEFGLKEHKSWKYQPRTEENVKNSDGTIRIASNFNSAGEKCTLKFINNYFKPKLDLNINDLPDPSEVLNWIKRNKIHILNIAGNSEKTSPGIEKKAMWFLFKVFKLNKQEKSNV